ncbi:hypothetical protein KJ596_00855 [Patescibacteria group bacterium]|nr:hypothetical protein [Patescibacteria group bacterium]MBU1868326.1 hypothetical protein [Patescibacteria group bacterium]
MSNYQPQEEKIFHGVDYSHTELAIRDSMDSMLSQRGYWEPTLNAFNKKLQGIIDKKGVNKKNALVIILDYLAEVLGNSEPEVMKIILARKKDVKQTRVSVAGNNFQALVAHSLMENVLAKNLPPVHIALKPKNHPIVQKYATIKIGNEAQKPDMDILIYQEKPRTPLVICSCKTSLRERAGQTYRWKLLVDLATADPNHLKQHPECPINKYNIEYQSDRKIYMARVTADLYNEIAQPQQRGMFTFFDKAFVTNKSRQELPPNVQPMSKIISYLRSIYEN